jgi:hypothetical protein
LALSCLLAACGGGGSNDNTLETVLTLTGTAATGAALADSPVEVRCKKGEGETKAGADGSFTVKVTDGALPCVLRAGSGAGALHSLIEGGSVGESVTVNVTPLTELIAARVAGSAPQTLFDVFDTAAQERISKASINAAISAVASALEGVVDLAGIDPLRDPLIAAHGSTPGNALDGKLDTLQARLADANITLAQLVPALASGGDALAPLRNALRCPSLRSGRYALLSAAGNEDAPLFFQLDAATLRVEFDGEAPVTLGDLGDCRYASVNDNSHEILVSKATLNKASIRGTQ